jgi:hypothetical protein
MSEVQRGLATYALVRSRREFRPNGGKKYLFNIELLRFAWGLEGHVNPPVHFEGMSSRGRTKINH